MRGLYTNDRLQLFIEMADFQRSLISIGLRLHQNAVEKVLQSTV